MLILKNIQAILDNRILSNAAIAIENGIIIDIVENQKISDGIDCHNSYCIPGLIDTHSDAIENDIFPRAGVAMDIDFALRAVEAKFTSAGITTVCHGITFEDSTIRNRTIQLAEALVDKIVNRRSNISLPLEHRILFRLDVRSSDGLKSIISRLHLGKNINEPTLISLENHAPGNGPFVNLAKFRNHVHTMTGLTGSNLDKMVEKEIQKSISLLPQIEICKQKLIDLDNKDNLILLAHDCEDEATVESAYYMHVKAAEFPLTLEAARKAASLGMHVIAGAPNIIRGKSHSGFVSATDLIKLGLCTSLTSDYLPFSLIAAPFLIAIKKILPIHDAIKLVTKNPAKIIGLTDRGEIACGLRADLTLVTLDGNWPRVVRTICANDKFACL